MKNKLKVIGLVSAMCFVVFMLTVGVLSLRNVDVNVGGSIQFNANGIMATVSDGVLSGSSSNVTGKMQGFTVELNQEETAIQSALNSWSGLELQFNENGDDVTITFRVTNNHTTDYLQVSVNVNAGTSTNATVGVNSNKKTLSPAGDGSNAFTYVITFHIENTDLNASISNFAISVNLTKGEEIKDNTIHILDNSNLSTSIQTESFNDTIEISPESSPNATTQGMPVVLLNFTIDNENINAENSKYLLIQATSEAENYIPFGFIMSSTFTTDALSALQAEDLLSAEYMCQNGNFSYPKELNITSTSFSIIFIAMNMATYEPIADLNLNHHND